ncbi:hypothetical protein KY290_028221 [Solanum tuberosum]|uniref:Uncharacterized protein n=2 Tax=Solanum tuberosum TaxID=4113 RepID=A0ABQ7UIY4_SOLTU|nr:hypothetical protein KY290_028221 [Solanum tuberosum]
MSGRSGRETHDDCNEGGGEDESGAQNNKNTNANKRSGPTVPPKRGGIAKQIVRDLKGSIPNPWATKAS